MLVQFAQRFFRIGVKIPEGVVKVKEQVPVFCRNFQIVNFRFDFSYSFVSSQGGKFTI